MRIADRPAESFLDRRAEAFTVVRGDVSSVLSEPYAPATFDHDRLDECAVQLLDWCHRLRRFVGHAVIIHLAPLPSAGTDCRSAGSVSAREVAMTTSSAD